MIYGMMRVKNEARWIRRTLRSMLPLCERIFVFDDHSTDDTRDICRAFEHVSLFESPFDETTQEVRDKNYLLIHLAKIAKFGDMILSIDGDEEIETRGRDEILKIANAPISRADAYRFHVLYLWDDEHHIRTDGIYGRFTRPSMFRFRPTMKFKSSCAAGFHCGNVPKPYDVLATTTVRLFHYGYMYKEDRIRKWKWYNSLDPYNRAEGYQADFPERGSYPHMIQGDVPEVPADAKLIHAGPLQVQELRA